VGPVHSTREDRSATLASCYRSSLRVAQDLGAESVAFPAISAGVYGWPMDDAARIAVQTIRDTAAEVEETIRTAVLVPFGDEAEAAFRRWLS
jgi:O-acetyl-ADP-ribose deacetylase (regulator of RNase III)